MLPDHRCSAGHGACHKSNAPSDPDLDAIDEENLLCLLVHCPSAVKSESDS